MTAEVGGAQRADDILVHKSIGNKRDLVDFRPQESSTQPSLVCDIFLTFYSHRIKDKHFIQILAKITTMAAKRKDNTLTNYQLVALGRSISKQNMKSIALAYLELDKETLKNIESESQDDPESFNRDVIEKWENKNSGDDEVKVSSRGCYFIEFSRITQSWQLFQHAYVGKSKMYSAKTNSRSGHRTYGLLITSLAPS